MKAYATDVSVPGITCTGTDRCARAFAFGALLALHTYILPTSQAPLADLAADREAGALGCGGLAAQLADARSAWAAAGGEASLGSADLRCVLPLADGRTWPWQARFTVYRMPDRKTTCCAWTRMRTCAPGPGMSFREVTGALKGFVQLKTPNVCLSVTWCNSNLAVHRAGLLV